MKRKNGFRYLSVNSKIFLSYVPILLLIISVGFSIFRVALQSSAIKKMCATKISELYQISDKMEYVYQNTINISNVCLFDDSIHDFLLYSDQESLSERSQRYANVRATLTQQHSIFYNIPFYTTIYGFRDDAYITNSPYGTKEIDQLRVEELTAEIQDAYSRMYWTDKRYMGEDIVLTAARYIFNPNDGSIVGMILIDFAESLFSETFVKSVQNNETISLLWNDGQIISSSNPSLWKQIGTGKSVLEKLEGYTSGYFVDSETSELVCFVKYEDWDLYIVKTEKYADVLQTWSESNSYLLALVIIVVVIFVFITILLSHYISHPLRLLTQEVRVFHNTQELAAAPPDLRGPRGDEIRYLREEFYKLQDRINSLIEQTIQEEEIKREYEIKALQNQINPHFLYNTLLSLRFLNRIGEREKLEQTILALVRLLSQLFEKDSSEHTIQKELEILKDYIQIQQTRYGNNFTVQYEWEEELLSCKIEKLILQPLVENAIFHGISSYEQGGIIQIKLHEADRQIRIEIWDNGVGLEKSASETENSIRIRHGIGLDNIKKRLQLIYGAKYSLRVFAHESGWTVAELIIPKEGKGRDTAK